MDITRTDAEISALHEACAKQQAKGGSKYSGMSYEDGIRSALDWITGESDDNPME